jgi:hypothetical protein
VKEVESWSAERFYSSETSAAGVSKRSAGGGLVLAVWWYGSMAVWRYGGEGR